MIQYTHTPTKGDARGAADGQGGQPGGRGGVNLFILLKRKRKETWGMGWDWLGRDGGGFVGCV